MSSGDQRSGLTWGTAGTAATQGTVDDPVRTDLPDTWEGPRFSDEGLLGRGGMGEVRLLEDHHLGRQLVRKEIRADLPISPGLRQRFLTEARITAQLAHPGIVPVHDLGELPDGRPFYTMREVRGVTLAEAIAAAHHGAPGDWSLRQLLDAVHRTCETVAYAHSRGIIHRDLKPDNIMLGEFGAVLVLDWGIARALEGAEDVLGGLLSGEHGLTRAGRILGTPGYLPPEQARGDLAAIGAASDVFSLGAVLYEALTGTPAFVGSGAERIAVVLSGAVPTVPPGVDLELARICTVAMQSTPAKRFSDAAGMARALGDWLAGARRRERALEAVAEADGHHESHRTALARAEALREEANAILDLLKSYDDAARKKPGWAKEDAAADEATRAELEGARFVSRLHGALQIEPDLPEAHARLSWWYRGLHESAEQHRDRGSATRYAELLRTHDRGEHADYLAGTATLCFRSEPPGAAVTLSRFVLKDRRLEPVLVTDLSPTPVSERSLPSGSYLLTVTAEGHAPMRYPVLLERGGRWDEPPVPLLPAESLGPEDCYVPAGPFWSGGDPEAADGLPARRVWVEGFVIRRHPVTNAEYLSFLNDLVAQGRVEEAERWAPGADSNEERQRQFGRTMERRFVLELSGSTDCWLADAPVVLVDWEGAFAFASWLATRSSRPWRLPHALEWEKAARGVDRRFLPWGNHQEPTWACVLQAINHRPRLVSVHRYPTDESPYSVRGMVGNARDWCCNPYRRNGVLLTESRVDLRLDSGTLDDWREARGGAAWNGLSLVRPCTRFGAPTKNRADALGFRLVHSI
ncbi:MAG: sulfatase activating formylglycine-generating enzyme [Myxococcota bacterium]|jgi:formylglycine-generating enzyme required for sulfatase activity